MSRKKLKITIECEGEPTHTFEVNGMAACLLTDGNSENTHGIQTTICGCMSVKNLLHLHDGVEDELVETVESAILQNMSPSDILRTLLGGKKHGSDR